MASGELTFAPVDESALPVGSVVTSSGRISGVIQPGNPVCDLPFEPVDVARLDDALTHGTRSTGVRFTVYLGPLGADPAARARELFPALPDAANSALIAVSPEEQTIEIVSGSAVESKLDSRVAQLGVSAAIASFKDGQLIDGITSAVRVMTAAIHPVSA